MAKAPNKSPKRSYAEVLRSNAANAGRWITRARDMLGDAIGRATGGQQQDDRNRFLRYFNSAEGRTASNMGRSEATQKVRDITKNRPGQLKPEKIQTMEPDPKSPGMQRISAGALQPTHIGGMFTYVYRAKTADDLPYYDMFPLIFMLRNTGTVDGKVSNDHFLGLNLHYVSPRQRALLMDAMNDSFMRNGFDELHPNYDPKLYSRLSYQILSQAARNRLFEPCVKLYRKDHVIGGAMVRIPGANWAEIMFLPTARWRINNKNARFSNRAKGQSAIWRESARR